MANANYRRGIYGPRLVTGGEPLTTTWQVSSDHANTFYPGDLVSVMADGYVTHTADADTLTTVAGMNPDTGAGFLGVCQSYKTKSTAGEIQVANDLINARFETVLNATTAGVGQTVMGAAVKFVGNGGVGRPSLYQSTLYATLSGAAEGIAQIVGYATGDGNTSTDSYPEVVVRFRVEEFS